MTTVIDTTSHGQKCFPTETEVFDHKILSEVKNFFSYYDFGVQGKFRSIIPAYYGRDDVQDVINTIFFFAIQERGDKVGEPINIMRITKNGIEWVQKNQPCK